MRIHSASVRLAKSLIHNTKPKRNPKKHQTLRFFSLSSSSSSSTIRPLLVKPIAISSSSSSSSPTWIHGALGGLAAMIIGGIGYMQDQVGGLNGLVRSLTFYAVAIPRYLEYRLLMVRKDGSDEDWEELHHRASQQGLDVIMHLRGFYIKTGQMVASNIGNAFPKAFQDTFKVLQDQCPHKSYQVVKSIIESEMGGQPLSNIFESFEEIPIGSASIGQVHRATLKNGDEVVVKVMYPEVESLFRGDVRTLRMFCSVAQPVHVPALHQIEKHFMTEFDYRKEALQQIAIRDNLIRSGLATTTEHEDISSTSNSSNNKKLCTVPRVYLSLCTKRVLVMEELKGEKLANGLIRDMERLAARDHKTPEQLQSEEKEKDRIARANGVIRKGPTAQEYNQYIALMNTKRYMNNAAAVLYNVFVGWWWWWLPGGGGGDTTWRALEGLKSLPMNHAKLMDDLFYIHGHEVLVNGYFNGDPHPGNILLLGVDEGKPRLGLIDYGQVKTLSKEKRLLMCQLIIALADDDKKQIVTLMKRAGMKTKTMNEQVLYKYAKVYYDEDNYELTDGLHIQLFVEYLESIDPIERLADDFIMVGRTSIMLRGLGHALHQSRSVAKAWRGIAEQELKKEEEAEEARNSRM